MKRIKVGTVDSIKPGSGKGLNLLGRKYAVYNLDGKFYGMEGSCKHMKAALAKGQIIGTVVVCPMHDWQYDIPTGKCLTEDWANLKTYPVEVEDNSVFIILE